jgi:hypothetical protein
VASAGVIHQDVTHRLRRDAEEMGCDEVSMAILRFLPCPAEFIDQPQPVSMPPAPVNKDSK